MGEKIFVFLAGVLGGLLICSFFDGDNKEETKEKKNPEEPTPKTA